MYQYLKTLWYYYCVSDILKIIFLLGLLVLMLFSFGYSIYFSNKDTLIGSLSLSTIFYIMVTEMQKNEMEERINELENAVFEEETEEE